MTTVLPQTRAGIIFQVGMAMGKFHGVMRPQTPRGWRTVMAELVGQLGGGGLAVHAAALAGAEEGHVDALLHVAAGLLEDLAHLARGVLGQTSPCSS